MESYEPGFGGGELTQDEIDARVDVFGKMIEIDQSINELADTYSRCNEVFDELDALLDEIEAGKGRL